MRRTVEIRPEARLDIREAYAYYEDKRTGLGNEFLAKIAEAEALLAEHAEAFQIVYRGARRYVLNQFPYLVTYRIEDDRVVIFGITHGSQHPKILRSRIR